MTDVLKWQFRQKTARIENKDCFAEPKLLLLILEKIHSATLSKSEQPLLLESDYFAKIEA